MNTHLWLEDVLEKVWPEHGLHHPGSGGGQQLQHIRPLHSQGVQEAAAPLLPLSADFHYELNKILASLTCKETKMNLITYSKYLPSTYIYKKVKKNSIQLLLRNVFNDLFSPATAPLFVQTTFSH